MVTCTPIRIKLTTSHLADVMMMMRGIFAQMGLSLSWVVSQCGKLCWKWSSSSRPGENSIFELPKWRRIDCPSCSPTNFVLKCAKKKWREREWMELVIYLWDLGAGGRGDGYGICRDCCEIMGIYKVDMMSECPIIYGWCIEHGIVFWLFGWSRAKRLNE